MRQIFPLLEGSLHAVTGNSAEVIEKALPKRCYFRCLVREYFRKDAREEAFAETGIDVSFYACRRRSADEGILP